MRANKSKFVREYQRKSKSPWDDHSTLLMLADYQEKVDGTVELSFDQYIYQHRDSAGRTLGISVSRSILNDYPEFDSQYLEGIDMYIVLLLLKEEIKDFCELFEKDFEEIFGLKPAPYFEMAELHWADKLDDSL